MDSHTVACQCDCLHATNPWNNPFLRLHKHYDWVLRNRIEQNHRVSFLRLRYKFMTAGFLSLCIFLCLFDLSVFVFVLWSLSLPVCMCFSVFLPHCLSLCVSFCVFLILWSKKVKSHIVSFRIRHQHKKFTAGIDPKTERIRPPVKLNSANSLCLIISDRFCLEEASVDTIAQPFGKP